MQHNHSITHRHKNLKKSRQKPCPCKDNDVRTYGKELIKQRIKKEQIDNVELEQVYKHYIIISSNFFLKLDTYGACLNF